MAGQKLNAFFHDFCRINVADLHPGASLNARMQDCFIKRLIGIKKLHIFANHRELDDPLRIELSINDPVPFRKICFRAVQMQLFHNDVIKPSRTQN